MVLNTLANNKIHSNFIECYQFTCLLISADELWIWCRPIQWICLLCGFISILLFVQYMYIVNLSTILQTQIIFLGVCILASLKFMPIFALILLWKISIYFNLHFFFHHTQSERDIFFCYRSMTLQTSIWCRGCSLSLIASSYIPLEWPVWQCLIECNFHLYHGFLHVHFFKVTVFNESHLNNTEWYLSTASVSVLAFAINLIRNFKFPRHLFNEVDKLVCLMG